MGMAIHWESHMNPMGMGIKHGIGDGDGSEWETASVGMGITCTPMAIYSVLSLAVATRQMPMP